MKFFALFALLAVFSTCASEGNPMCQICFPFISVPETWSAAKALLKMGCGKLGDASNACLGLVNAADLTSSYPKMYPHIVELRKIGCEKYCPHTVAH